MGTSCRCALPTHLHSGAVCSTLNEKTIATLNIDAIVSGHWNLKDANSAQTCQHARAQCHPARARCTAHGRTCKKSTPMLIPLSCCLCLRTHAARVLVASHASHAQRLQCVPEKEPEQRADDDHSRGKQRDEEPSVVRALHAAAEPAVEAHLAHATELSRVRRPAVVGRHRRDASEAALVAASSLCIRQCLTYGHAHAKIQNILKTQCATALSHAHVQHAHKHTCVHMCMEIKSNAFSRA
jgi:hypothetical protein